MQLLTRIAAASTVIFLLTVAIIGITIPVGNKYKNSVDCSAVKCEANMECIKEDGESPTCTCISGFMTIEREADKGSEKLCHKKCETTSDCVAGEVCNGLGSGIVCTASMNLESCDDVRCEDPFGCELVNDHPQCKCRTNELLIDIEVDGTSERLCVKTCDTSSDCAAAEVCNSFESGIGCIASMDLDSCDDVLCEGPDTCQLVDTLTQSGDYHPQCKCPSGQLLIDTEPDGTANRRCRKSCTEMDDCEPGTLCFRHPSLGELYCEERDVVPAESCSDVQCSTETECLTRNDNTDCYCKRNARTLVTRTATGSKRICGRMRCSNEHDCDREETLVCYTDPYTLHRQCVATNEVESCDYVNCSSNFACLARFSFACGCLNGESYIGDFCFKVCSNDEQCETAGLGTCDSGHCRNRITSR